MSLVAKCTYNFSMYTMIIFVAYNLAVVYDWGKCFYKYYTSTFPFPHYCEYVVLDCNLCGINFD